MNWWLKGVRAGTEANPQALRGQERLVGLEQFRTP
jgi:hypothetical protein